MVDAFSFDTSVHGGETSLSPPYEGFNGCQFNIIYVPWCLLLDLLGHLLEEILTLGGIETE